MVEIAVVEDDRGCVRCLREFLTRYGQERKEKLNVVCFPNGAELVRDYHPIWDVILLDIEMPEMDGMTAARRIRGYEVDALDFLLKPVSYFAFAMKLDKALRHARSRQTASLVIPQEDGLHRLLARDICYVEVSLHRLHIHTVDGVLFAPGSLTEMERKLAGEPFAKCNKGYLVNLRHVKLVKGETVLVGGDELLVSRRKKKEFLQAVTDYYGGGGR